LALLANSSMNPIVLKSPFKWSHSIRSLTELDFSIAWSLLTSISGRVFYCSARFG
jgi:ATP adenylyltransferase/5',5'''-P-1,P-4-tetraphosphate phosphorylase II